MNDIDDLEAKIRKARHEDDVGEKTSSSGGLDYNAKIGMQAGAEFVASIAVTTFIGYQLDKWLDTKPLFLLILLMLGMASGFYGAYRVTQKIDGKSGVSKLHIPKKDVKTAAENKKEQE